MRVKWLLRGAIALATVYGVLFSAVAIAMVQPPERFGAFMKRMPAPLVWGGLPAKRMWLALPTRAWRGRSGSNRMMWKRC
jgi:hypothetical protein